MAALGYANYDHNSIFAIIGFPYNRHPKPYARFSTQIFDKERYFDSRKILNAIAGLDVYDDLIKTVQKLEIKIKKFQKWFNLI